MEPTSELMHEHVAIKAMLEVLDGICDRLEAGEEVDAGDMRDIVGFIRGFADACHHGKEEDYLFPAMERAGIPRQGGPLGVMAQEHELGRAFVARFADAVDRYANGDKAAAKDIVEYGRDYISLLALHIDKEDNVLYPMADANLPDKTQGQLTRDFAKVEEERIGPGKHEEYYALLKSLQSKYPPSR